MATQRRSRSGGAERSASPAIERWGRYWQRYWDRAGAATYELPAGEADEAWREHHFLMRRRTPEGERERLVRIRDEFVRGFTALYPLGPAVTVFGSARLRAGHRYYRMARATGAELARAGFAVLTGGGPGIMEAASRGAHETGGPTFGLNITLPHEQQANRYADRTLEFHYFFVRKVMLMKYSCAFVVMPGGLGTLDEMFEAATLLQCGKIGPFPLVLMGTKFWEGLRRFSRFMVREGVVERQELAFGRITDSPAEAVELVLRSLPPALRAQLKPITTREGKAGPRPRRKPSEG